MRWKRIAAAALGLVIVAGAGAFAWLPNRGAESLSLPGTVECYEVRLSPRIAGRVTKVHVVEGETVEASQAIVQLEVPGLEAQRDQCLAKLAAAEAELRRAEYGPREEEKATARAAAEGAKAKLDRLRAGPRLEELDQARSELESTTAELERAWKDLNREERLISSGASSRSQYDTTLATHDRLRGQMKVASARLRLLEAGTRPEEIHEAEADLAKAQAQYELLKAGTRTEDIDLAVQHVRELRARVAEIEADLREATVRAPERAIVEVLAVRPGDVVAANQSVARVLRSQDLWVKAFVPETKLGKVRLNQTVQVTVDSYAGRRFEGRVVQVASASEFTPRNVQSADERRHQVFAIKVQVTDPDGIFKSGMAAEVLVPLDGR